MPGQPRSNRRRSPRSSVHRPPRPVQSHSAYGPTSESIHNRGSSGYQLTPLHYSSPPSPYDQRAVYGRYPVTPHSPVNMEHTPPFPYHHPYHHSGMPDSNMMNRNIHANYQPMLQPPAFPYQRSGPEGSHVHPTFAGAGSSSMYGHHPVNTSPPIHSPPTSAHPSPSHTPYPTGAFHSLGYPTSMSSSPYGYPPPQAYSASPPIYQQYPPAPYPPQYSTASEAERQGTWWYMLHAASPTQQFDTGAVSYQNHYTMAHSSHHNEGEPYSARSPSSPGSTPEYPVNQARIDVLSPSTSPLSRAVPPPEVSSRPAHAEKLVVRRPYHPNPPAHRSEWVMWAGNVPSDATHDELWRYFNQPPEDDSDPSALTGVLSIFLISRSSCAFVNYDSEEHLDAAIQQFNGRALRPSDPRCARLLCRVRKKDDDLKAGVGGQRGVGIHTRWIKERQEKAKLVEPGDASDVSTSDDRPSTASSDQVAVTMSSLSISSDDPRQRRNPRHSSSSGSYTSTNSSLLSRFFPQRYFILKSLTQYDLDLSVEKGLWATQKHNEGILDQAYRTSQDVYLIFSVNKSGEFYGYAKMAGPIRHGEERVPWASRTGDSTRSSFSSAGPGSASSSDAEKQEKGSPRTLFFSPGAGRLVDQSPLPVSTQDPTPNIPLKALVPRGLVHQSAPPELGGTHQKMTMLTPESMYSLDSRVLRPASGADAKPALDDDFELDSSAPIRAMRSESALGLDAVAEEDEKDQGEAQEAENVETDEKGDELVVADGEEKDVAREDWGESFKVQWICTERLPFTRTRHLRNPWNHDREVKVSRDGTELEPTVGRRLLEEWKRPSEDQSVTVPAAKAPSAWKRGSKPAPSTVPTISTKDTVPN
ncbi:putative YT521-B-like domain containing protein [Lyophyllum shimeji]|uniref:YT521-B-like domain containing protein n=1 Tax=Lyophyllum shimeji TaxID=47721 RepID=A0A9P3PNI8_LYOSH|nr:putative YT521-B-like domain containing protein [Lyophyllum shimeji]